MVVANTHPIAYDDNFLIMLSISNKTIGLMFFFPSSLTIII